MGNYIHNQMEWNVCACPPVNLLLSHNLQHKLEVD
jgi:hypothetical protein